MEIKCQLCQSNVEFDLKTKGKFWCEFNGPNKFFVCLEGEFEILCDHIVAQSGIVCLDCIKNYDYVPYKSVLCDLCLKKFHAIVPGSTCQGHQCSSEVFSDHIEGYYGSCKYDEDIINFVSKRPNNIKIGHNICDDCIDGLINTGICQTSSNN